MVDLLFDPRVYSPLSRLKVVGICEEMNILTEEDIKLFKVNLEEVTADELVLFINLHSKQKTEIKATVCINLF